MSKSIEGKLEELEDRINAKISEVVASLGKLAGSLKKKKAKPKEEEGQASGRKRLVIQRKSQVYKDGKPLKMSRVEYFMAFYVPVEDLPWEILWVTCLDEAKLFYISDLVLANRLVELIKEYCTAQEDEFSHIKVVEGSSNED